MKTIFAILFLFAFLFSTDAANNSLTDEQLLQIKFDQKLNSQVSPALIFRDETGKQIQIGNYFGKRPIVLILGYYSCPMLCTLVLNGATESFRELKANAGEQFDVIFVSIDPAEMPSLAAEKKKNYLREYGRRGNPNGWHFLTGDKTSIQTLADEVGFHFAYDPALKHFAHPSGFVVLTPDGKVSHYFFGVTFSPKELDLALHEAKAKKIGSPVEQFILLCCEYSPLRGKYGNLAMAIVRVGGISTVVVLGIFFVRTNRRKSGPTK
jgi:protein SCO1/2